MFDDLLDLFDRGRRDRRAGSRPGLLRRIFGGHDGEDDDHGRYEDGRRRPDDEGRDEHERSRRRERDFEFDD